MLFSPSEEIGSHIGKEGEEIERKHAAVLEGRAFESPAPDSRERESSGSPY